MTKPIHICVVRMHEPLEVQLYQDEPVFLVRQRGDIFSWKDDLYFVPELTESERGIVFRAFWENQQEGDFPEEIFGYSIPLTWKDIIFTADVTDLDIPTAIEREAVFLTMFTVEK